MKRRDFLGAIGMGLLGSAMLKTANPLAAVGKKPNIVLILGDDMPWFGTTTQMRKDLKSSSIFFRNTPHLDKLASDGMIFENAYSSAGMCAPSRCSIQTGMAPARHGFTGNSNFGTADREIRYDVRRKYKTRPFIEPRVIGSLDPDALTIGESLKKMNYSTAHFGKWHIYGGGPGKHGYDKHDGETSNDDGKAEDPNDPKLMFSMTKKAIAFMEENQGSGRPFFVQISHYVEHNPDQSMPGTLKKYEEKPEIMAIESRSDRTKAAAAAAMVEDMDTTIGTVLKKIEDLGIADNTCIFYTSDNGKARYTDGNNILRGGKWWLWECGIRVPLFVKGPGIKPGGRCRENVVGWDLLPSIYDLAGGNPENIPNIDGMSIKPLLANTADNKNFRGRALCFHYPHYRTSAMHSAIIKDDYKLLYFYEQPEKLFFYNIKNDIGERNNLTAKYPERAKEMYGMMMTQLKKMKAYFPKPNPKADPDFVGYDPDTEEEYLRLAKEKKKAARKKNKNKKKQK